MAMEFKVDAETKRRQALESELVKLGVDINKLEGEKAVAAGHDKGRTTKLTEQELQDIVRTKQESSLSAQHQKEISGERAKTQAIEERLKKEQELAQAPTERLKADVAEGRAFGREAIGDLGRVDATDSADVQRILAERRAGLSGLSAENLQAERDVATENIDRSAETARRRLLATQAATGVRGATAGAQVGQVLQEGMEQRRQFERDLFLRQAEAKKQALSAFEASVSGAEANKLSKQQFNLQQAAKEKFGELATGFGFAQLASSERTGKAAIDAQQAASLAAAGKSSGISHVCTVMRDFGYLNDEVWASDNLMGTFFQKRDPHLYAGYSLWAAPLSSLLRKFPILIPVVSIPVVAWANNIHFQLTGQGSYNRPVALITKVCYSICRFIGKFVKVKVRA